MLKQTKIAILKILLFYLLFQKKCYNFALNNKPYKSFFGRDGHSHIKTQTLHIFRPFQVKD